MPMTYPEALRWLHGIRRFGSKPGQERIGALARRLGHPERRLGFVHVTGTNGKGSTAAMIESILRHSGLKTGLYVSPFVEDFRERLQIGGAMLSEDEWACRLDHIRAEATALVEGGGPQPTEFELLVGLALQCLAEHGLDVAVMEVGMGGRSDATNIIPSPAAAVITSISLDHMRYLGSTLADITREKCGIIKPGCRVVTHAGQPRVVMEVIGEYCARMDAGKPVCPDLAELDVHSATLAGTGFAYKDIEYEIPLCGSHQVQNALCAIEAACALRERGFPAVAGGAIASGLAGVRFGGRLEIVGRRPLRIIDGAHNPGKMAALSGAIDDLLPDKRLIAVMGMSADKDCASCVPQIASRCDCFIATEYSGSRALPANDLAKLAAGMPCTVETYESLPEACARAMDIAGPEDAILACGSLYMIGEAKRWLGPQTPVD